VVEIAVQDERLKWPDSFAVAPDSTIYVTTAQIHLGSKRTDPYRLFKLVPRELPSADPEDQQEAP
jgi:hypothetical protein